jgi:FRG domain
MGEIKEIRKDKSGTPFTAQTYLEYIRPSNSHWWEIDEMAKNETCPWVFRGHASSDWKLVPSAFRKKNSNDLLPLIEYFESLPIAAAHFETWNNMSINEKAYRHLSLAYRQAIYELLAISNELGFLNPFSFNNDSFPANLKNSNAIDPKGDYYCFSEVTENNEKKSLREIYEITQHRGLPTHLLDWTKSPIFAAHFATNSWLESKMDTDIAIWAMNDKPYFYSSHFSPNVELFAPSVLNNTFAKAQLGRFTVVNRKDAEDYFIKHGEYPAIEDLFLSVEPENNLELKKIILPKEHVPEFRRLLDREGITNARLQPGFDSIVSTIKLSWKNLK